MKEQQPISLTTQIRTSYAESEEISMSNVPGVGEQLPKQPMQDPHPDAQNGKLKQPEGILQQKPHPFGDAPLTHHAQEAIGAKKIDPQQELHDIARRFESGSVTEEDVLTELRNARTIEDELYRTAAVSTILSLAHRQKVDVRSVLAKFATEEMDRKKEAPSDAKAIESKEGERPQKKKGLKKLWHVLSLKERRKRRKKRKEEKSRLKIFRLFEKPVRHDIAMHVPGINPETVRLEPHLRRAYARSFEKSGIMREGAFRQALEQDPHVARLFRQEIVSDVQQAQQDREQPERASATNGHVSEASVKEQAEGFAEELRLAGFSEEQIAKTPQDVLAAMQQQREELIANRAQSEGVKKEAGAEFDVLNQVRLPHGIRADTQIPTAGITNPNLLALVQLYNSEVTSGRADLSSIESTRDSVRRIVGTNPAAAAEAQAILGILNPEFDALRTAQEQEHIQMRRQQEREQDRDIIGRLTDDNGVPLTEQRTLVDRRMRNKVFNDLYRLTDSRPRDLWQQAWNPLSQGLREEAFFNLIQGMSTSPNHEVVRYINRDDPHLLDEYVQRNLERFSVRFGRQLALGTEYQQLANDDERNAVVNEIRRELDESFQNYKTERSIRENLHNINAYLYRTSIKSEELFGAIQQFSGEMTDVTNGIFGVKEMMDVYEAEVRLAMVMRRGYLRPEDVLSTTEKRTITETDERGNRVKKDVQVQVKQAIVEERSKARLQEMYKNDVIKIRTADRDIMSMRQVVGAEELQPWELDRIMTLARGNMIASMRLISLASESRHPDSATRFGSSFLQDVLQTYSPNIHFNTKYWAPGYKTSSFLMWGEDRERFKLLGVIPVRRYWSVSREFKKFKQWKEHTIEYINKNDLIDANRQNPNRSGDAFTWIYPWKVGETLPINQMNESFTRDFLDKGLNRMIEFYLAQNPASQEYQNLRGQSGISQTAAIEPREIFQKLDFKYRNLDGDKSDGQPDPPTPEDIIATNLYIYRYGVPTYSADQIANIIKLRDGVNEYKNWIGTGLRLELLRSSITDNFKISTHRKDRSPYKEKLKGKTLNPKSWMEMVESKQFKNARESAGKAMKIIERMVDLQPDKIFLASRKIQGRTLEHFRDAWRGETYTLPDGTQKSVSPDGIFSEDNFQELLRLTTADLQMLQTDLYGRRDELIGQGYTFNGHGILANRKIELDSDRLFEIGKPDQNDPKYQQNPALYPQDLARFNAGLAERAIRKTRVDEFRRTIRADYDANKGAVDDAYRKNFKDEPINTYFSEFVKNREFFHGFVLWTGDAPMDEFNMAAVGQTGAFARAAGNNLTTIETVKAQATLMSEMKNIKTIEDAVKIIQPIYSQLSTIDLDLANGRTFEVADNMIKWLSADWKVGTIPYMGLAMKYLGRASYAQRMYGRRMPVWGASQKREFLYTIKEKGMISEVQFRELVDHASARAWQEVISEQVKTIAEIALIFFMFYVMKKALEKE